MTIFRSGESNAATRDDGVCGHVLVVVVVVGGDGQEFPHSVQCTVCADGSETRVECIEEVHSSVNKPKAVADSMPGSLSYKIMILLRIIEPPLERYNIYTVGRMERLSVPVFNLHAG